MTTQSLPALLRKYNLQPQKGLGQNFLADPHHLTKIVDAADLKPDDTVLEVGPGPGTLTRYLVEVAGRVVAVELDPAMIKLLKNEFGHFTNLTIFEANILDVEIDKIIPVQPAAPEPDDAPNLPAQPTGVGASTYKVVANIPYYITAAVLRHLLETPRRPARLVVTVQQEVAQRIIAGPGKMSVLAVSVQFYGRPTVVHQIPAGAFYPPPKVDSTVVCIDTYRRPPIAVESANFFFRVVKAGFSQKRKKIKNALAAGLHRPAAEIVVALSRSNVDSSRRAETLSLEEWGRLVEVLPDVL